MYTLSLKKFRNSNLELRRLHINFLRGPELQERKENPLPHCEGSSRYVGVRQEEEVQKRIRLFELDEGQLVFPCRTSICGSDIALIDR